MKRSTRKVKMNRKKTEKIKAWRHCPVCHDKCLDYEQPGYYVCDKCKAAAGVLPAAPSPPRALSKSAMARVKATINLILEDSWQ